MPLDGRGRKLHVGDTVNVPCVVTGVDGHEEYCNIAVETLEAMFPGPNKTAIVLNTRQVILTKRVGASDSDIACLTAIANDLEKQRSNGP
jgi:hypothetical protein